jgi:hypothetical protein
MTGYRHLYLLSPPSQKDNTTTKLKYDVRSITQGDNWQVDNDVLVVDEVIFVIYLFICLFVYLFIHLFIY